MRMTIRKGLDIPLAGRPEQHIGPANDVFTVAVLGSDFRGVAPHLMVQEGQRVRCGQPLFSDKTYPEIRVTAPGCGQITAINRGAKRVLQSIVIALEGNEEEAFASFDAERLAILDAATVCDTLLASGLWAAIRTRPFSRIPSPATRPPAIFVTAIDTNPLTADPAVIIGDAGDAFANGLHVISRLTDGRVYVCTAPDSGITCPEGDRVCQAEFAGPHPAGLVGTHIHLLHPVNLGNTVWHLGYQDVIAIGRLFTSGRMPVERIAAISGPCVKHARLVRTRRGASITDLLRDEVHPGKVRLLSGSVLSGYRATGPFAWLGRYHNQITVLRDGSEREFLGWLKPGVGKFSSLRAYASHLLHRGDFALTTSQNGSPRAMVPIGAFERVIPLDLLPTPLLKALLVRDLDRARDLGCLELDEEDLALCSFVCNGKYEYGPYLREVLDELEREI